MATKKTIGELVYIVKADGTQYEATIKRADEATDKFSNTAKKNQGALDDTVRSLAGAYLGYQGLTKAIDATIGSAISYESAFAGVRKTVNGTEEQLQSLSDEFIGLSKSMPVTAEEFAKIGELAGQLGVPIENIADFAKTIAMVGTATNLTTEQASTDFARFANILQLPLENVDRLGATIVGLGNNLATTESEIDAMALRIAGAGATLGLTAPQVLGWAGALSSVGIEAEAGGSSISRLMIEISAVTSEGGKALDKFARVAGVSAEAFAKKYKEDANGALKDFFAGLQKIQEGGGDLIGVLNNLGITEVRQRDAVLRLVGAGDILTKSLDLANDSWTENTALQTEAEKRYKTTSSQLTILKNNWADLGRQLGTVILPIVNLVIEFFRQMSQTVVVVANAVKTAIFAMGTSVVGRLQGLLKGIEGFINGAIDLANKALGAFGEDSQINHVTLSVKALDDAVQTMKDKTVQAGKETADAFWAVGEGAFDASGNAKKLSDAQTLLTKGSGEASDEIKNLTDSLKDGSKASKDAEEEAKKLADNWTKLKDETVDLNDKGTEAIRDLADNNVKDLEKIEEKISDLRKQLADLKKEYNSDLASEDSSIAEKIVAEKIAIEELNKKLTKARQEKTPDYTAINELEAEISKRQSALNDTIPLQAELKPAIDEANRRSGLTDLQKAVEDYQAKKAQITLEFEEKRADLEARLALEEQNKAETIALYEDKQNQINGIIELGNQRFKNLADNRVKITEDEVKKQIYWYNQLADAIARSKSATRTSELPQYSVGGYVPSGGQVHAGEYVIPANMVAKYGSLISSLEGIRTGATNSNTVNNNVNMNNVINEQIDMEAVLKNLSFSLTNKFMIGVQYELTNQNGDTIIINDHSDPLNVIALQDYPSFDLEIKNQEINKEGQHGIWDFFSFYGKRLITFSGVIVGEDEAHVIEIQNQLKQVVGLPLEPSDTNNGLVTIKYTDPRGRELQTTGKVYSSPRFSRVMRENFKLAFQLVLKSANPDIESQNEIITSGVRGYEAGVVTLPTIMPTTLPILKQQTLTVTNSGNTYASPKITINGALTNPRLDNLTTGKFLAFTRTLTVGQKIIIDVKLGTIVDESGVDISADLDVGSEFIKLVSGANLFYLTSDENLGATNPIATRIAPAEIFTVEHRDTFL